MPARGATWHVVLAWNFSTWKGPDSTDAESLEKAPFLSGALSIQYAVDR
jgi:hypothetical protein